MRHFKVVEDAVREVWPDLVQGEVFSTARREFTKVDCPKCGKTLFIDEDGYVCEECGRVEA